MPGLLDQWWAVVRDATQLRATAARGRRIKARMLLAVIRQTGASGQACDLAQSVANDLTGRVGRKKKPMPPTEGMIKYFIELGLSRRAARVLTRLGCQNAHAVLRFNPECFDAQANCGRVTIAELRTFVERRRLQDESGLSINKG